MQAAEDDCILSQEFTLYPKKLTAQATLTNTALTLTSANVKHKSSEVILLDDVIGCHVLEGNKTTISQWYLCVFSYPMKKKTFGGLTRQRITKSLGVVGGSDTENRAIAEKWKTCIKYIISGKMLTKQQVNQLDVDSVRSRNFLVYVNPFSGSGKAVHMYKTSVRGLFAEADINHTCIKTEYAGHARENVKQADLSKFDGIVIVSGDGLVHEVINGLMEREDWKSAIKTPLGVVPGGSGNALAAAVVYASVGQTAKNHLLKDSLFEIARGRSRDLSLMYVQSRDRAFYSFLNIGWGFVADVDIESEKYRLLGKARFTVGCAVRVANLRKYHGMISYLPAEDGKFFSLNSSPEQLEQWTQGAARSKEQEKSREVEDDSSAVLSNNNQHFPASNRNRSQSARPATTKKPTTTTDSPHVAETTQEDGLAMTSHPEQLAADIDIRDPASSSDHAPPVLETTPPDMDGDDGERRYHLTSPLTDPIPARWRTFEGEFVFVMPVYLSHIGDDMVAMPTAKFDDDVIFLYCLKHGLSKARLTRSLLGFENGSHLTIGGEFVTVIPARAFRLEPFSNHTGLMTCDGETIPHEPLQASVTNVCARVMCSSDD